MRRDRRKRFLGPTTTSRGGPLIPAPQTLVECLARARAASAAELAEAIEILEEQQAALRNAHPHASPCDPRFSPGYEIAMLDLAQQHYEEILDEKLHSATTPPAKSGSGENARTGKGSPGATITAMPPAGDDAA